MKRPVVVEVGLQAMVEAAVGCQGLVQGPVDAAVGQRYKEDMVPAEVKSSDLLDQVMVVRIMTTRPQKFQKSPTMNPLHTPTPATKNLTRS